MMTRLSRAMQFTDPELLNELNTTNAKQVLGARMSVVTGLVCAIVFIVASIRGAHDLAETVLFYWLTYLAAYAGLGVVQFGVKRNTDKDTKVAVEEARAKQAPPQIQTQTVQNVEAQGAPSGNGSTAERAALRPRPTGAARFDDERGYDQQGYIE